jgi:galactitol-specific phosphotransferase system IIC component
MFLVIFLPVLLLVGMALMVGAAVLPFAVAALIGLLVYRVVSHHHGKQAIHPH